MSILSTDMDLRRTQVRQPQDQLTLQPPSTSQPPPLQPTSSQPLSVLQPVADTSNSQAQFEKKGRSTRTRVTKLTDDDVEQLILIVQAKPPLWNMFLPLVERAPDTLAKLWQEVSDEMDGTHKIVELIFMYE